MGQREVHLLPVCDPLQLSWYSSTRLVPSWWDQLLTPEVAFPTACRPVFKALFGEAWSEVHTAYTQG